MLVLIPVDLPVRFPLVFPIGMPPRRLKALSPFRGWLPGPAGKVQDEAQLRRHARAGARAASPKPRACSSSSRSTGRPGCTTTFASSWTASCSVRQFPRARAMTPPTSAWLRTSRTTPFRKTRSRALSPEAGWRWQGGYLGQGHLGASRRPARGLQGRRPQVRALWPQACAESGFS